MKKTAFEIGAEVVTKLATSRWREAIRSGEVAPGSEAETLKTRMGVDPHREALGLQKGWEGRAHSQGYVPAQIRPTTMGRLGLKAWQGDATARELLWRQAGALAGIGGMGSPAGVYPLTQMTVSIPALEPYLVGMVSPKTLPRYLRDSRFREELRGAMLGHEGSELAGVRRLGETPQFLSYAKGPKAELSALMAGMSSRAVGRFLPADQRQMIQDATRERIVDMPQAGMLRGAHMSPRVLLEEARNVRMLSPETQSFFEKARQMTGEMPGMRQMVIPKHQMGATGQGMAAEQAGRRKALQAVFAQGASSPLQALKGLVQRAGGLRGLLRGGLR